MDGRELAKLVVEMGMSPVEFCAEADISIPTYYKFLHGERIKPMSRDKVEAACKRLKANAKPRKAV